MKTCVWGTVALMGLLVFTSDVKAQNQIDFETRIGRLEQQLAKINQDVTNNSETLKQLAQGVVTNGDALRSLISRIEANEKSIQDVLTTVDSNNRQLKDIAKQDAQGGYYPNLLGNMQKPEFRGEFRDAVKESGATRGRLWIYNPGPYNHIIYVNGTRWTAILGESYVWVPFGNVSVTHYSGITPPTRTVDDWEVSNGEYQIRYDFRRPW